MSKVSLKQLVDELVPLNDENLVRRVIETSDVQWCLDELQDMLADDVAPVVHGTWEKTPTYGVLMCSACRNCYIDENFLDGKKWNFCPECGAHMIEWEDSNGVRHSVQG